MHAPRNDGHCRANPVALAMLFILLLSATEVQAATYYVDAGTGSNQAGGDEATPWATLQHAAASVTAGDTVVVRAGNYDGFELTTSGTADARINFQAEPGVTVTSEINLEGASYVTLDGFQVTGSDRAGIRAVLCQHVWLLNNRTYDNYRWGIFTGCCNDLVIQGNECSGSEDEHGIYVSNSGDRPVIRNNLMWGNNANGLHMNGDESISCSAGFVDNDGVISGAVVEANRIYDNGRGGGSGINGDGVSESYFANNLVYSAHASGMSLYRIDGGAPSTGNLVVNNTIVVASDGRWAMNIQDGSTNNTLLNNILLSRTSNRGSIDISSDSLSGLTSDYNVVADTFSLADDWVSLSGWQSSTGQDNHSLVATIDQTFLAAGDHNYQLSAASPARDTGTSTNAPNADLAGRPRPLGPSTDIGAYEYCEGDQCGSVAEDCSNTVDDDADGDTDCDDADCSAAPLCQPLGAGVTTKGCGCHAGAGSASLLGLVLLGLLALWCRPSRSSTARR